MCLILALLIYRLRVTPSSKVREVKVAVFLPILSGPRGTHFMDVPSISHSLAESKTTSLPHRYLR